MGLGAPAWVLLPPVALEEPIPKAILEPSCDKSGTRWLKAGALQWPLHGECDLCGAIAASQAQGGGGGADILLQIWKKLLQQGKQ